MKKLVMSVVVLVVAVALLSGCAPQIVWKTRAVIPSKTMMARCDRVKPSIKPSEVDGMDRDTIITKASDDFVRSDARVVSCDNRFVGLQKWADKQREIYDDVVETQNEEKK